MSRHAATLAVAAVLAATFGPTAAKAQETERCYGVARAGANDGIGDGDEAGSATVDFQGDAWISVESGACLTLPLPDQPDGTPRRGSYEPLDRDRP